MVHFRVSVIFKASSDGVFWIYRVVLDAPLIADVKVVKMHSA